MTIPPTLLTKSQAAKSLSVCVRTIENFMRDRRMSFIKLGKSVRIDPAEIERLKQTFTVQAHQ